MRPLPASSPVPRFCLVLVSFFFVFGFQFSAVCRVTPSQSVTSFRARLTLGSGIFWNLQADGLQSVLGKCLATLLKYCFHPIPFLSKSLISHMLELLTVSHTSLTLFCFFFSLFCLCFSSTFSISLCFSVKLTFYPINCQTPLRTQHQIKGFLVAEAKASA